MWSSGACCSQRTWRGASPWTWGPLDVRGGRGACQLPGATGFLPLAGDPRAVARERCPDRKSDVCGGADRRGPRLGRGRLDRTRPRWPVPHHPRTPGRPYGCRALGQTLDCPPDCRTVASVVLCLGLCRRERPASSRAGRMVGAGARWLGGCTCRNTHVRAIACARARPAAGRTPPGIRGAAVDAGWDPHHLLASAPGRSCGRAAPCGR